MTDIDSNPALVDFATGPVQVVPNGLFKAVPALAVAVTIWYIELRARGQRATEGSSLGGFAPKAAAIIRGNIFEVAGLVGCMALAAGMLLRGDHWNPTDPADLEAWNKIKAAWPLLTTADSLIAMQAMLRLPPLISTLLRPASRTGAQHSPFVGGPAALAFCASACRVGLQVFSPYHRLDGPLSGWLHASFEVAALPVLLALSRGALSRAKQAFTLAVVLCTCTWVASRHRLAFADDSPTLDTLFTLAELMELSGAALYLARTAAAAGRPEGAAGSILHAVLPLQQGLSMYYWLVAFNNDPGLAAVGEPLTLMRLSSTVQVGIYLMAGALHLGLCAEGGAM